MAHEVYGIVLHKRLLIVPHTLFMVELDNTIDLHEEHEVE